MKSIKRSAIFIRHYKQRIASNQQLRLDFLDAVAMFLHDPTVVADHALRSRMGNKRSFSINEEYRVIYSEKDDYYFFEDIGTHGQVYHW